MFGGGGGGSRDRGELEKQLQLEQRIQVWNPTGTEEFQDKIINFSTTIFFPTFQQGIAKYTENLPAHFTWQHRSLKQGLFGKILNRADLHLILRSFLHGPRKNSYPTHSHSKERE